MNKNKIQDAFYGIIGIIIIAVIATNCAGKKDGNDNTQSVSSSYSFEEIADGFMNIFDVSSDSEKNNTITASTDSSYSVDDFIDDLVTQYYTPSKDDFAYAENEYGEIAIKGINPEVSGNISIPDYIDGKPVKVIYDNAFEMRVNITAIKIPDTVTEIGDSAFICCSALESIRIPDSVTKIGDSAFSLCVSLKEFIFPEGITAVSANLFNGCLSLENVGFTDNINDIGESAFEGCIRLKTISLPNRITRVSNGMFYGCTSLIDVAIPSSVTEIGSSAFADCSLLAKINIPTSVVKIGNCAFANTAISNINIPENVVEIGFGAFSECKNLIGLDLSNVEKYGTASVFYCCDKLEEVILPEGVDLIEASAFYGCPNLKRVVVKGDCSVAVGAFEECDTLNSIVFEGKIYDFYYGGIGDDIWDNENFTVTYNDVVYDYYDQVDFYMAIDDNGGAFWS